MLQGSLFGTASLLVALLNVLDVRLQDQALYLDAVNNPATYHGRVRLMTAAQMYEATLNIAAKLSSIDVPLLLLHGGLSLRLNDD
jgi:hypothetical protein